MYVSVRVSVCMCVNNRCECECGCECIHIYMCVCEREYVNPCLQCTLSLSCSLNHTTLHYTHTTPIQIHHTKHHRNGLPLGGPRSGVQVCVCVCVCVCM
jgi:hypothetical protein